MSLFRKKSLGAPDWDSTPQDYGVGSEVPQDGWIVFGSIVASNVHMFVAANSKSNVIKSFGNGTASFGVRESAIVPVKKGDKIYVGYNTSGTAGSYTWCDDGSTSFSYSSSIGAEWKFYPCKK